MVNCDIIDTGGTLICPATTIEAHNSSKLAIELFLGNAVNSHAFPIAQVGSKRQASKYTY